MKNFITWLYLRYVLTPMFEESEQVIYMEVEEPISYEQQKAMYEKEVVSRVCRTDH